MVGRGNNQDVLIWDQSAACFYASGAAWSKAGACIAGDSWGRMAMSPLPV